MKQAFSGSEITLIAVFREVKPRKNKRIREAKTREIPDPGGYSNGKQSYAGGKITQNQRFQ